MKQKLKLLQLEKSKLIFFIKLIVQFSFFEIFAGEKKCLVTTRPFINEGLPTRFIAFDFENFPLDDWIILSVKRDLIGQDFKNIQKIKILDQGVYYEDLISKSFGTLPVYNYPSNQFLRGEEVEFQFQNLEGEVLSNIKIIPRKITKKSNDHSFSVSAKLSMIYPTNYLLNFEGLIENEMIDLQSKSENETVNTNFKYQVGFEIGYMPGVLGQQGGKGFIRFNRETKDFIELNLPWGVSLLDDVF